MSEKKRDKQITPTKVVGSDWWWYDWCECDTWHLDCRAWFYSSEAGAEYNAAWDECEVCGNETWVGETT